MLNCKREILFGGHNDSWVKPKHDLDRNILTLNDILELAISNSEICTYGQYVLGRFYTCDFKRVWWEVFDDFL